MFDLRADSSTTGFELRCVGMEKQLMFSLAQVRPGFLRGVQMLTEFSSRNRWVIVGVVAGACLSAFLSAGLGQRGTPSSQDRGVQTCHNGAPETNSIIAISAKAYHPFNSENVGVVDQAPSSESTAGFETPAVFFGASQWPQQSAGAYCSLRISKGAGSTFGGMIESDLLTKLMTCRTRVESHNCGVHQITEPRDMSPLGQFRWNGFHQHSPNSQGSVLVNF
jgi:hypothetical protein